jgi:hypothetical protein
MPPVLLTHSSPTSPADAAELSMRQAARAATEAGFQVVGVPWQLDDVAELALRLPPGPAPATLSGYLIPSASYLQLERAAAIQGLELVNDAASSARAMWADRRHGRLGELAPDSMIVGTKAEAQEALVKLGAPVFVKGLVKSRKEEGIEACLARDLESLLAHLERARAHPLSAGGKIVAQELLELRSDGVDDHGFPRAREYRFYLHRGEILGSGRYWCESDAFGAATAAERAEMEKLALEAARRLEVPLLCLDLAQTLEGQWLVVDVGDPQFSRLTHIPAASYFAQLYERLSD